MTRPIIFSYLDPLRSCCLQSSKHSSSWGMLEVSWGLQLGRPGSRREDG